MNKSILAVAVTIASLTLAGCGSEASNQRNSNNYNLSM